MGNVCNITGTKIIIPINGWLGSLYFLIFLIPVIKKTYCISEVIIHLNPTVLILKSKCSDYLLQCVWAQEKPDLEQNLFLVCLEKKYDIEAIMNRGSNAMGALYE